MAQRYAIQLLCQQRLHGGLTIGDTHEADEPGVFETQDRPMDLIVQAARHLIGDHLPAIERRWSGVYHQVDPVRPRDLLPQRGRHRRQRGDGRRGPRNDVVARNSRGELLMTSN